MKRLILTAIAFLAFVSVADAQYSRQRFRQRSVFRERAYAPLAFRQRVYAPLSFRQSIYELEAVIFEERIGSGGLLNLQIGGRNRSRLFLGGERRGLLNIQIGD